MNWKKFNITVSIIVLLLLTVVGLLWYLQGPQEPVYVFPPKPLMNWQTPQNQQGPEKPTAQQKKLSTPNKKKAANGKPMNVSLCEDNPNAPDYLSRQMARENDDNDTCAKVKLNMDF